MHGTGVRYFYYYLLLPIIFVSIRRLPRAFASLDDHGGVRACGLTSFLLSLFSSHLKHTFPLCPSSICYHWHSANFLYSLLFSLPSDMAARCCSIWRGLSYCACLSLCVCLLECCGQVDIALLFPFNDVRWHGVLDCKTRTCEFIFL